MTGAQENGSGAVMAMPVFVAEELGMRPEDFSILYQDTAAANWDMGSCGSQTTFNSGRAILAAAADVREQLLDARRDGARGRPRGPRARRRSRAREGLARPVGDDRRPRGAVHVHGKGSGEVPAAPTGDTGGCVGRLGNETFAAPQLITQAAHVKVDRETGVVRVLKVAAAHDSGVILNRAGADGQVTGRRRDGRRAGAHRGHAARRRGPPAEPAPARLQAGHELDAPEIEVDWIQIPTPNAGPRGSKGVGEPPQVPTAGAIANAIAKVLGAQVHRLPMTPERVWAASSGDGA